MRLKDRIWSGRFGRIGLLLAAGLPVAAIAQLATPASLDGQTGEGQVSLAVGTAGPDAALQDLEENDVSLLSFANGKPMLIEFWASWCEQCEALQPQIDAIHEVYADDIEIVAVAVAVSQNLRRVRRHVDGAGHGYPFLWDAQGNAVRAYKAATTAIIVILDEDGNVAYTGVGPDQDLIGVVSEMVRGW